MKMEPSRLTHQAISASAGSGKTFALAHRYIRLLAHGESPDRIMALTFSRKAAGEIFDSVVENLRKGASDPAEARKKADLIGAGRAGPDFFLGLLRVFVDHLHRAHIGTLDSFIVGIARAFPAELGIPSRFEVMDTGGAAATEFRDAVLADLCTPGRSDRDGLKAFLDAFKLATFGKEEKALRPSMHRFLQEYREQFQVLPDLTRWGAEEALWPGGCPWPAGGADPERPAQELRKAVADSGWTAKAIEKWVQFADAAARFQAGAPFDDLEYLYEKLLEVGDRLPDGPAVLGLFRQKKELTAGERQAAWESFRQVTGLEIHAAIRRTQGIGRLLASFETAYDAAMRLQGKLTFSDTQYLLTGSNACSGGALLSRLANREGRLYIDFRLDCRLDHWLLDEFQDTSDLQWAALRNLADELLQDQSGARSFFYVGDVKQSIYAWRGGNSRLFRDILDQYPRSIEETSLTTCRRSAPPIVETVNAVFSRVGDRGLPAGAVRRWAEHWQTHEPDPDKLTLNGYTALIEARPQAGAERVAEQDLHRLTAALLRSLDPLRRGLSAAVLVRTNDAGRAVTDVLRAECPGLAVVHEGESPLLDNPVVSVLLSLVKYAQHPGDLLALRHLQMSPLWDGLVAGADPEEAPARLLREIQEDGFAALFRHWGAQLNAASPLDAFGRHRLGGLLAAAREFDAGGRRDGDAFLRFAADRQVGDVSEQGAVRVMTIHKSKGLGFDVVILPELDEAMDSAGRLQTLVGRDERTHLPKWVLQKPRDAVVRADAALTRQLRAAEDEAGFDALCLLYVAMTRAKRGLYLLTRPRGKTAETVDFSRFLAEQLAAGTPGAGDRMIEGVPCLCRYETGDAAWFAGERPGRPARGGSRRADLAPEYAARPSRRQRLLQVEPSAEEDEVRSAARLFEPRNRDILDFGSAIHALFEQIEWVEDADAGRIIAEWSPSFAGSEDVRRDVCEQFRQAVEAPDARRALARPPGACALWREKRFEIILEGREWVTGAFDRVVVHQAADGRPLRADLLDYKSNQVTTESELRKTAERYRGQMSLYVRALSHILRIDRSAVRASILFTRTGRVIDMAAG